VGKIVVTGGAGYIGSHIVRMLSDDGAQVVVIDDLSRCHRSAVGDARLVVGDFGERKLLDSLLGAGEVDCVVHMAARSLVGESVTKPGEYYRNNVARGLVLLDAIRDHRVPGLIFSSSAAVYGEPSETPINEQHPTSPTNPYGETKLALERAFHWYRRAYGSRYVSLRYFNAAGAQPDGTLGEDHEPESHLIPNLLQALSGDGDPVPLFGDDYPTPDGTCVRDYVHVVDLARAHVLAIERLRRGELEAELLNLGNGEGFSVREVVDSIERVTGQRPPTRLAPRRAGDPARLVASASLAEERLGWRPELRSLDEIVATAWNWHRAHPRGFDDRR